MKKKWLIGIITLGVLIGGFLIVVSYKEKLKGMQQNPVTLTPNDYLVSPAIIDAVNDVTHISSMQSGVIDHIYVTVGQVVKKGAPLFSLHRELVKNAVKINRLNLERNRKEQQAELLRLNYLRQQLKRLQSLDKRAISQMELQDKKQEVAMAEAHLLQTRDNLRLAIANLNNAKLTQRQYLTRALKNGVVLQINAHVNEFIGTNQPIIYLADAKKVIVRVSIDERDVSRFHPDASAYLINYNNPLLNIPLTFIQLDQYIVVQERLNSRVQEALYYFNRDAYPLYAAGQLFDVHIDAKIT